MASHEDDAEEVVAVDEEYEETHEGMSPSASYESESVSMHSQQDMLKCSDSSVGIVESIKQDDDFEAQELLSSIKDEDKTENNDPSR